ncbi:hypothetical protein [Mycobacterium intracellulare]|uniref:hypothetical protein n=1 Tax=Mycobacterium intracellulare TaxID=1767 RepID=UPI0001B45D0A|nr:hypothetical protein [Mycobacterium intracellulare]UGU07986.1 hypothetical protein LTQ56_04700 [Mycobacterium intracellulare subsp. intracellulare]BCO56978.1 hypothetical protein MINTM005_22220 [Mycobacterium intracellulare]BCO67501.1 hypothetical protein MINTM007_21120 [Mycobacterium intracellulare]BCO73034.1 hypothetical protein MINTM008_23690 [Mycobacterium intracellulare]BCO78482.1 hypothetical protein MINTM009_22640 [Mycobacterium intracellulare]
MADIKNDHDGRVARLARAFLPKLTDEQLLAGGLTEDEVREVRYTMGDESNYEQIRTD